MRGARERVADGWTQGTYARNDKGEQVSIVAYGCDCFCAEGAILHAVYEQHRDLPSAYDIILAEYAPAFGEANAAQLRPHRRLGYPKTECIIAWNDDPERTQAQVVAAFDRAIAHLEEAA